MTDAGVKLDVGTETFQCTPLASILADTTTKDALTKAMEVSTGIKYDVFCDAAVAKATLAASAAIAMMIASQ